MAGFHIQKLTKSVFLWHKESCIIKGSEQCSASKETEATVVCSEWFRNTITFQACWNYNICECWCWWNSEMFYFPCKKFQIVHKHVIQQYMLLQPCKNHNSIAQTLSNSCYELPCCAPVTRRLPERRECLAAVGCAATTACSSKQVGAIMAIMRKVKPRCNPLIE